MDPKVDTHRAAPSVGTPYILIDNLATALMLAIDSLATSETRAGYAHPSALRAGLMDNLKAIMNGRHIEVRGVYQDCQD